MTRAADGLARLDSVDQAHAYRIQRVARLLRHRATQMFAELSVELSVEQWVLLWRVYERGPCSQRSLADPLLDDRANITRLVARLQTAGWIEQVPDSDDRRRKLIALTEGGRARFEGLFDQVVAIRRDIFGGVDPDDLAAFERVLSAVERNLSQAL